MINGIRLPFTLRADSGYVVHTTPKGEEERRKRQGQGEGGPRYGHKNEQNPTMPQGSGWEDTITLTGEGS